MFSILIVAILLSHVDCRMATLTGVPFEMMGFYSLGDKFECLDKSKTIKFSAVNDDYCDCPDGSDEPGTSACNNGRFYCLNEGHVGKFIPSIWVNDGYCDCCDGSDEYAGAFASKCNDTCQIQADVHKEKIDRIHNNYLKGHEIYKSYQSTVNELVNKRLSEKNREREEEIAKRTEQAQQDFENRKKHAEEKLAKKAKKIAEMEEAAKNVPPVASPVGSPVPSPVDEFDPSAEADKIIAQEAQEEEKKEEEEDEGGDPTLKEEEIDINEEIIVPTAPDPITAVPEVVLPDYGPNNIFVHLTETECLNLDQNEYTYKLCPFKGAYQLPRGSTHSETNLGKWGKWINMDTSDPLNRPIEMLYEKGTNCWNGPDRSTNVIIHCGEVEKLISAEEPSRCQYKFVMTSPTACSKTADEMLQLVKESNFEGIVLHDEL